MIDLIMDKNIIELLSPNILIQGIS